MKTRSKRIMCFIFMIPGLLSACGGNLSNADFHLLGTWGGEHIQAIIGEMKSSLEYDCAFGTIDEPVIPDENGHFTVSGFHRIGHGGPSREGELPDRHPAWYVGWTDGHRMNLTVTLADTEQVIGAFNLVYGNPARLFKCY